MDEFHRYVVTQNKLNHSYEVQEQAKLMVMNLVRIAVPWEEGCDGGKNTNRGAEMS